MTSYFFQLEGRANVPERVEMRLEDAQEARAHTTVALGDLLRAAGAGFWDGPDWQLDVTDEFGQVICSLKIQGRTSAESQMPWPSVQTQTAMAVA